MKRAAKSEWKVGDVVTFTCTPYKREAFEAIGFIRAIDHERFSGGAAQIQVLTKRYIREMRRTTTFVGLDKLKHGSTAEI